MLQCPSCQTLNEPNARFCKSCGKELEAYQPVYAASVQYAGFWIRFVAALLDGIILSVVLLPLAFLSGIMAALSQYANVQGSSDGFIGFVELLSFLIFLFYFAIMESSKTQGTLGKMALGIKVTDQHGQRISFGRAVGRNISKLISKFILYIGYMMAGWTKEKTALHDLIAGTRCIKKQV